MGLRLQLWLQHANREFRPVDLSLKENRMSSWGDRWFTSKAFELPGRYDGVGIFAGRFIAYTMILYCFLFFAVLFAAAHWASIPFLVRCYFFLCLWILLVFWVASIRDHKRIVSVLQKQDQTEKEEAILTIISGISNHALFTLILISVLWFASLAFTVMHFEGGEKKLNSQTPVLGKAVVCEK